MSGNEQLDIAVQQLNNNTTSGNIITVLQYLSQFLWIPLIVFFVLTLINFIKYKKLKNDKNKKIAIVFLILTIIVVILILISPIYPHLIAIGDTSDIFE